MTRRSIRILFCSIPDIVSHTVLQLLADAGFLVDSRQEPEGCIDDNVFLRESWDLVVMIMRTGSPSIDSSLSQISRLNPTLPVALLHDAAYEFQATRLLSDDAQVKMVVSVENLESFPQKLDSVQTASPPFTKPVPVREIPDAAQYRKFVEIAHEGIWVIDEKGMTTYVNPAMAGMLGYHTEEMIGKHLFAFMDERGVEITKRNMRRREQGIIDQHDFELLRKDGTRIYTVMETSPIVENGTYKGSVAGVIDVTSKYQTEQRLRRANRALRTTRKCIEQVVRATDEQTLLNNICQIIETTGGYRMAWIGYAQNDNGKCVVPMAQSGVDREYLENLNVSWSDSKANGHGPTGTAIRTGEADIARDITVDERFTPWRAAAKDSGVASSIALPLKGPDKVFGALNIYSTLPDAFDSAEQQLLQELADDLAFGILALRDHKARLQAEAELRQHQEHLEELVANRTAELQRSNQELESFSYTVSHDLRAPLRHINGYCHLLAEDYGDRLDDSARDYLNRMQAATQRMGDLIDHLLTLAKLNQQSVELEAVDLSYIANGIIRQLRERYPGDNTQTVIAEHLNVIADKKLISVALQNLLDNAWKFTRHSNNPQIEFGVTRKNGKSVYFVKDNGIGFDMAYVDTLFRTFNRLHSDEEYEGSGIGLVSVQHIIERHGGRIWAEAEEGKGASFYFTLPEKHAH